MSLNIQTTSSKTEFLNYFSNPITIPPNSTIALNKVACRIPVWVQKVVRVPDIPDAPTRANECLKININGVQILITWNDLFTAHTSFATVDIEGGVTIDNYFSGNFEYFANNNVFLIPNDLVGQSKQKIPFVNVLAKAIDTKLEFYECIPSPVYKNNEVVYNPLNQIKANTIDYDLLPNADTLVEIGFQITYAPKYIFNSTPQPITGAETFDNIINTTITTDAINGDIISTTDNSGGGTFTNATAGNFIVDTNGGYWRFKPNLPLIDSSVVCGFHKGGNQNYSTGILTEFNIADINFGIKFNRTTHGGGTSISYQILDGTTKNVYHGGNPVDKNKIYPQTEFLNFNNDTDYFYISVRRALTYEHNNNEYIFQVYLASDEVITNSVLVYQSDTFLATPNMPLLPIVIADNVMPNVIKDNKYIPMGDNTPDMGEYNITDAIGFCNKFTISALTSEVGGVGTPWAPAQLLQIVDFWKSWGISSLVENDFSIDANRGSGTFSKIFRLKVDAFNNPAGWNINNIYYCIGVPSQSTKQVLVDLYKYNDVTKLFTINRDDTQIIDTLPDALNVYINDLPIKNYSGVPPDLNINQSLKEKLLGSVSLVDYQDIDSNIFWVINYEVFNNLYRPLNNPNPLSINQLNGEISYDIGTRRHVIPNLDGLLKIDMNIRSQGLPKPPQNNLLSTGR